MILELVKSIPNSLVFFRNFQSPKLVAFLQPRYRVIAYIYSNRQKKR